jgi:hypothetical protein
VLAILIDLDGAVLNPARRTVGCCQPAYPDASLLRADRLAPRLLIGQKKALGTAVRGGQMKLGIGWPAPGSCCEFGSASSLGVRQVSINLDEKAVRLVVDSRGNAQSTRARG